MNTIKIVAAFLLLFVFGAINKSSAQKKLSKHKTKSEVKTAAKKVTVSGTVTQSNSYCGGARPNDEILAATQKPYPFPNKKFHLIKEEINTLNRKIILSFTTDSAGNFSFQVVPGTYSILLDEQVAAPDAKKYQTQFIKVDESCFKDWWAKPYYLLEVGTANIKALNFDFHHRCFIQNDIPCLQYEGPLPP